MASLSFEDTQGFMSRVEFNCCTLSKEEEEEMKNFFMLYDIDENGMLELDELQKMFANFNVIALKEDIKAFFEKVIINLCDTID
jgi:Ca2+-binding EF-hand superfamily protein